MFLDVNRRGAVRRPYGRGRAGRSGEPAALEEGIDGGRLPPEALVEDHGVFAAAAFEDVAAEGGGGGAVEDAVLLEDGEGVRVEHFRPFVAVVACGVSSAEDVPEGGGEAGSGDGGEGLGGRHGAGFEVGDGAFEGGGEAVPCHVHHAEAELAVAQVAALEVGGAADAVDVFRGDGVAGLVVDGEGVEPFLFERPVLHDLGGQFHEVAQDVGACRGAVGAAGEHAVEGVPELVEEGGHLVEGEEGGGGGGGLGEVGDDGYDGAYVPAAFAVLGAEVGHPCASSLAFAGEEVEVEDGEEGAVRVAHLEGADVLVVAGDVARFAEGEPVEAGGEGEDAFLHFFQAEVGAEEFVVEGVALLFEAVGVVCPVPALEGAVEAFGAREVLGFLLFREGVGV